VNIAVDLLDPAGDRRPAARACSGRPPVPKTHRNGAVVLMAVGDGGEIVEIVQGGWMDVSSPSVLQ
jgi:hypothetical protein